MGDFTMNINEMIIDKIKKRIVITTRGHYNEGIYDELDLIGKISIIAKDDMHDIPYSNSELLHKYTELRLIRIKLERLVK